jgi:hypothetical protein
VSAQLLLGKDQLAVQHHLELPALPLDELGFDTACVLDLGRQTGGPGKIVSLDAVGDLELGHRVPPGA